MAYVNPTIFQIDFDDLTDWTDEDTNGCVSSISPAGQLYLDDRAIVADYGIARRTKDLGTTGDGNYYVEIKFKGDVWDGYGGTYGHGITVSLGATTNRLFFCIGNSFADPAIDGILVHDGTSAATGITKTWDNEWHTVVFYVHNSQTDVDIWVDKAPSETPDATDIDCSYATDTDGFMDIIGWGTADGNGQYHIDYIYVGIVGYVLTADLGEYLLTGTTTGLNRPIINMVAETGEYLLTGINIVINITINMAVSVGQYFIEGISVIFHRLWENQAKDIATFTNLTKTNISPTNATKHSISPANSAKTNINPTNASKTNSSWVNQDKS